MNKHIFCSRKDGATIKGKFYPAPRVSAVLAQQAKLVADKMQAKIFKSRH